MMKILVLAAKLFATLPIIAAIITERNDVYKGSGCHTPPQYTFVGTSSYPGIASVWIPYGTYTDGVGGTEYTRVTSNLMGVVASALGGLSERRMALDWYARPYMLRPIGAPIEYAWWHDGGEFFGSTTNLSLRIADQLNLPLMYLNVSGTNYYYEVYGGDNRLEPELLDVAKSYGSRKLEELIEALGHSVDPPISTNWTSTLPYSASTSLASMYWRYVYPVLGNCSADRYFMPEGGGLYREFPYAWSMGSYEDIWGHDLADALNDLQTMLYDMPLPFVMEDILSADTGWDYGLYDSDYAHWTNGTTRLDWRRLGIICQLERQMDTTYLAYPYSDQLPLWHMESHHLVLYEGSDISIDIPAGETVCGPYTNCFSGVTWDRYDESYESSTNKGSWSTPTCRIPAPHLETDMYVSGPYSLLGLDEEEAKDLLGYLCSHVTNKITGEVTFEGHWKVGAGVPALEFRSNYVSGTEILPSNVMHVVTSTGFDEAAWKDEPIGWGNSWYMDDGAESWATMSISTYYGGDISFIDHYPSGPHVQYHWHPITSDEDGSVMVPQVTFTSYGEGPFTNWMWRLSGIPGLPADNLCRMTLTTDYGAKWTWEGYSESDLLVEVTPYDSGWNSYFHCHFTSSDISIDTADWISGAASSWTSPSVAASWTSGSYEREFSSGETVLPYYEVYGNPPSGTWDLVPHASIDKDASATFTYLDGSMTTRTNVIHHNDAYVYSSSSLDWDRLRLLRRSELELLLFASGSNSHATETEPSPYGNFTWENIKDISGDSGDKGRWFRMLNGTFQSTLDGANGARYNFLANLSGECKTRCRELGGMPIGAIADVGKVTSDEFEEFSKNSKKASAMGYLYVESFYDDDYESGSYQTFTIRGNVHLDDDDEYVVDAIYEPDIPCSIGRIGWYFTVSYPSAVSNVYKSVRADALQAPVDKRIWKFKNLRDPNLR